jgi:hypothetical protein
MEKRYCDNKEIISKCSWCEKKGVETYLNKGVRITDSLDLWDIEDKLERDIAVISHGICTECLLALYPDYCHES